MSRALAALLVVLYHARVYVVVDPQGSLATLLYAITACGPQSVIWFFVISGYLVGGSVIQGIAGNRFNFKSYLIARISRLYLVLIPALAWCYLWDTLRIDRFGLNAHAGFETASSLSFPTLIANLTFLETIYAPTYGSNFVLWSLASEFWYYLLFPLLLAPLMFNRTKIVRYGLLTIGVVLLSVMAKRNFSMAWLFIPWLLGATARISPWSLKSEPTAWIIAALAAVAYPYLHGVIGPLATLLVAVTFTGVLLAARGNANEKVWRSEGLIKLIGGFSFSLYLTHLPLLHFLVTILGNTGDPLLYLPQFSALAAGSIVCVVCISVVVAYFFAQATERHTYWVRKQLESLFRKKPVPVVGAV